MAEKMSLYVDLRGNIWKGPFNNESNFHYARLHGVTNGRNIGVIQPIWCQEKSESDPSWLLIGEVPPERK